MLREIGTVDRIPEYVQGVKDKKYRLMALATGSTRTMTRAPR